MIPEGFCDITATMRSGVYLLLRKGVVVYVGQSAKLYARVGNHITGRARKQLKLGNRTLRGTVFDQIAVMAVPISDLDRVEKELIERYIPEYNRQSKPKLVIPIEDLIAVMPCLPPCPEPRQYASWRRL